MKNKLPLFCLFLYFTVTACHATLSFIGNGYVILNPNGAGDTYYKVDSYNTSGNPSYSGNLLTLQSGQSLMLGGEIQTWQPQFGVTTTMHYSIDQNTTFSDINLNWFQSNGNDYWHAIDAVNIGSNLSAGTHTVYIWFSATDGGTTIYDNNGGANFFATISVVPEPSNIALASFALLAVAALGIRTFKFAAHGLS